MFGHIAVLFGHVAVLLGHIAVWSGHTCHSGRTPCAIQFGVNNICANLTSYLHSSGIVAQTLSVPLCTPLCLRTQTFVLFCTICTSGAIWCYMHKPVPLCTTLTWELLIGITSKHNIPPMRIRWSIRYWFVLPPNTLQFFAKPLTSPPGNLVSKTPEFTSASCSLWPPLSTSQLNSW